MSDIVNFPRVEPAKPKPATLKTHFGADASLLSMASQWRSMRAQMEKNWADHEHATGFGWLDDEGLVLDRRPLEMMHTIEDHLAMCEPRRMLTACEMLRICSMILAKQIECPQHTLAQGPVLDLIRNVLTALEAVKSDLPIGEDVRLPRPRRRRR